MDAFCLLAQHGDLLLLSISNVRSWLMTRFDMSNYRNKLSIRRHLSVCSMLLTI